MSGKILLIEPNYKAKYPPLGLMKIATFHNKDNPQFFKGTKQEYIARFGEEMKWDRIYISTVFTFQYNKTIETLKFALNHAKPENIFLGGVATTLLKEYDDFAKKHKINVVKGLLNKDNDNGIGLAGDHKIDEMIPDYSILEQIYYQYPTYDAYIAYSTRGCVNKCDFCAVPKLEGELKPYKEGYLVDYVKELKKAHGVKKDLLLLDNNITACDFDVFDPIIKDIETLGFGKGSKFTNKDKPEMRKYLKKMKKNRVLYQAKYLGFKGKAKKADLVEYIVEKQHRRHRHVDFNQGLEAKKLVENELKMKRLGDIAIRPSRIAFDHINLKNTYVDAVKLADKYDIKVISNYLLFNHNDKPEDLLNRIMINIELNEEFAKQKNKGKPSQIFSFPMKYMPLNQTHRQHVGKHWTKKELRAIQAILIATHGVVGPKREFNQRAFCDILKEVTQSRKVELEELMEGFKTLLWMPENYIIHRVDNENKGTAKWKKQYHGLSDENRKLLHSIIGNNMIDAFEYNRLKPKHPVKKIIDKHYEVLIKRKNYQIRRGYNASLEKYY